MTSSSSSSSSSMTSILSITSIGTVLFSSSIIINNLYLRTYLKVTSDNIRDYLSKVSIKTRNSKTIYLESFDDYDHKYIQSNDSIDNSNNSKGMNRSDSEYSLGFSRSKSLQKIMNEIGPFCDTGEILLKILRYGSFALITFYIATNMYRKKKIFYLNLFI